MRDQRFCHSLNEVELAEWSSFVEVVKTFLGKSRFDNYKEIVNNMLENLRILGIKMSRKVHFLYSHLVQLPEKLVDVSSEQDQRFHQDIKAME